MATANMQKLIFLAVIGMIFLGLFAGVAYAAQNPNDWDGDGIPNKSDPNPNQSNIFDFVGLFGDWLSKDMIAGIVMFAVLFGIFTILGHAIFGRVGSGLGDESKNAVYVIAGGLAFAGVYFAYGTGTWGAYVGLFTLGPVVLFVVLVLAGLFVVVSWAFSTFGTAKEAWREIPGSTLTQTGKWIKQGFGNLRQNRAISRIEESAIAREIINTEKIDEYLKGIRERLPSLQKIPALQRKQYLQNLVVYLEKLLALDIRERYDLKKIEQIDVGLDNKSKNLFRIEKGEFKNINKIKAKIGFIEKQTKQKGLMNSAIRNANKNSAIMKNTDKEARNISILEKFEEVLLNIAKKQQYIEKEKLELTKQIEIYEKQLEKEIRQIIGAMQAGEPPSVPENFYVKKLVQFFDPAIKTAEQIKNLEQRVSMLVKEYELLDMQALRETEQSENLLNRVVEEINHSP